MVKLVEKIMPENSDGDGTPGTERSRRDSLTPLTPTDDGIHGGLDVLEASLAHDTPVGLLLDIQLMEKAVQSSQSELTSQSHFESQPPEANTNSRHEKLSKMLFALFPAQERVDAIVKFSTGIYSLASRFYSFRDIIQGQADMLSSLRDIPPATSHPAVLAQKLLQLVVCIQQLKPEFDYEELHLKASAAQVMAEIINTVTNSVTSKDDLVCTQEGLECLIILGFWHENAGNLRKSWLTYRKAMSVGQLMGIDQANCGALKSADPSSDPSNRTCLEMMWFRLNFSDRYLSLMLGLPVGSVDSSFASGETMQELTAMERLERLQAVASTRIVERNRSKSTPNYGVTEAIDLDLETAARGMETGWWVVPSIQPFESGDGFTIGRQIMQILLQIHHYNLLILLHLPHMLQDPTESRSHYSKETCTRSSRAILQRYITFRSLVNSPFSCRHIDYAALIAAMTLLLSYLKQPGNVNLPQLMTSYAQRQEDRQLIEVVRERMDFLAVTNDDKVSKASAEIIRQMIPILDSIDSSPRVNPNMTDLGLVRLSIPYLGNVNFHPRIVGKIAAPTDNIHAIQSGRTADTQGMATLPSVVPEQPMDFTSFDSMTDPADTSMIDGMFIEFELNNDSMLGFPDMAAEVDEWVLQGVESTYWSFFQDNNFVTRQ